MVSQKWLNHVRRLLALARIYYSGRFRTWVRARAASLRFRAVWDMNRDRAAAAKAAALEGNPMLVDSGRPSASAMQQGSSSFLPSGQLPGDDLVLGQGKRPCLSS